MPAAKPRSTYVLASPQTWELIRAAYLAGLSAPAASARFGVSESGLRKRAQREGWTKTAYAAAGGRIGPAPPGADAPARGAWTPGPAGALPLDPGGIGRHERMLADATPPLIVRPAALARRALQRAAGAIANGQGSQARALAAAARDIAALDQVIPDVDPFDDTDSFEARQSIFRELAWAKAAELAELMVVELRGGGNGQALARYAPVLNDWPAIKARLEAASK